jgi:hypothetical protein
MIKRAKLHQACGHDDPSPSGWGSASEFLGRTAGNEQLGIWGDEYVSKVS